jgi:D-glycero-beta-D-manno-heptose-7-phosphate kinase
VNDAERLAGARVLVIGDVMLDEHVWGDVSRISPEAPVPVVDVRRRTHVPGGAANAAAGVAALSGYPLLGGAVGEDRAAALLRGALDQRRIDYGGLIAVAGRTTTTKTRVIADGQQVVRMDAEEQGPLPDEAERRLLTWAEGAIESTDVVVLSDYGKGVVSRTVARSAIQLAAECGVPLVVDPKGRDYEKYRGATVLTPNAEDARRAAGLAPEDPVELDEISHWLADLLPDTHLLITRGAQGMSLVGLGTTLEIPADAQEIYDVTGAGDTVVAALAVALARGLSLPRATRIANVAAGIVVGKIGTATVALDELAERLDQLST